MWRLSHHPLGGLEHLLYIKIIQLVGPTAKCRSDIQTSLMNPSTNGNWNGMNVVKIWQRCQLTWQQTRSCEWNPWQVDPLIGPTWSRYIHELTHMSKSHHRKCTNWIYSAGVSKKIFFLYLLHRYHKRIVRHQG